MKLKRLREAPHTYQDGPWEKSELRGQQDGSVGEELATQPGDLSLTLGTHTKEGERTDSAELSSILHTGAPDHTSRGRRESWGDGRVELQKAGGTEGAELGRWVK